jgi:WS/DGAT/MGAT family acyltransferase
VDDPGFAVENHVKPFSVTAGASLEAAVDEILELNEAVLDRSKPLWMMYVVDGVPGKTLLLSQVHHAMIDGVSGIDLLMILLDFEPEVKEPPLPKSPWRPAAEPGQLELLTEAVRENFETMAEEVQRPWPSDEKSRTLIANATRAMTRFVSEPAVLTPWNAGLVGPKRKMRWTRRLFSEFREIRRAFGGTINDVVLAAVTEGAARYLAEHNEDTGGRNLRLMCPVSVRTEDEQGALGNRVSGIFPSLPATPMRILERYHAVLAETEAIKRNEEAQALTLINESTPSYPAAMMAPTLLVSTAFDPTSFAAQYPGPVLPNLGPRPPYFGINFTCTNVPGVQVPLYIAGHRMETMLGVLMLGGPLGYGVAVGSYNQEMVFAMIGETRLMPDLDNMAAAVDGAFEELLAEARKINAPPSAAVKIEPAREAKAAEAGAKEKAKISNKAKKADKEERKAG